ncbi:hypothetical protein OAN13_04370 [Opitutales bacterium]|nr:hypothetical protein [Opitutales bacterium]
MAFFITVKIYSLGIARESGLYISSLVGDAYVIKNEPSLAQLKLEDKKQIPWFPPFAVATRKHSFLEVNYQSSEKSPINLRLGQATGLEIRDLNNFYLIKGSILYATRSHEDFFLESNSSMVSINGSGTCIIESTFIGFKIIVMEGHFNLQKKHFLKSGDLVLISGPEGNPSEPIKIELPLLLNTSRLVNQFSSKLCTNSRLISAAKVQSMRMKTKYNAFIGGVSDDKELRIWAVEKNIK